MLYVFSSRPFYTFILRSITAYRISSRMFGHKFITHYTWCRIVIHTVEAPKLYKHLRIFQRLVTQPTFISYFIAARPSPKTARSVPVGWQTRPRIANTNTGVSLLCTRCPFCVFERVFVCALFFANASRDFIARDVQAALTHFIKTPREI